MPVSSSFYGHLHVSATDRHAGPCPSSGDQYPCASSKHTCLGLQPLPAKGENALEMYDSNGNGRITCSKAREHGISPVRADKSACQYRNDRDNDCSVFKQGQGAYEEEVFI